MCWLICFPTKRTPAAPFLLKLPSFQGFHSPSEDKHLTHVNKDHWENLKMFGNIFGRKMLSWAEWYYREVDREWEAWCPKSSAENLIDRELWFLFSKTRWIFNSCPFSNKGWLLNSCPCPTQKLVILWIHRVNAQLLRVDLYPNPNPKIQLSVRVSVGSIDLITILYG